MTTNTMTQPYDTCGDPATVLCEYCDQEGIEVDARLSQFVPAVDDHNAWAKISTQHEDDCEWVRTRAHRLDIDASEDVYAGDAAPHAIVVGAKAEAVAWGTREQVERVAALLDVKRKELTARWVRPATPAEIRDNEWGVGYLAEQWIYELEEEATVREIDRERDDERRWDDYAVAPDSYARD